MTPDSPRLYLVTPPIAAAADFAAMLEAALDAADVACVLLRLAARDEGDAKRIVRGLSEITARHDAALLLDGDVALAARAGADGVHVRGSGDALVDAIERLKPERIVGSGGLALRHDAMQAAEVGADYVLFGEPSQREPAPALADTLARTRWWAEIFNVPCVAWAERLDWVPELARAGADFVAVGGCLWEDPRGIAAAAREATAGLASAAPAG